MAETTSTKKVDIASTIKKCGAGFKSAPLSTKIAAGAGATLLSVATFFIGRATKKTGKK